MKQTNHIFLIIASLVLSGCMQTRKVEMTSVNSWDLAGKDSPSSYHNTTLSERCWQGFWFCQPARIQP